MIAKMIAHILRRRDVVVTPEPTTPAPIMSDREREFHTSNQIGR